VVKKQIKTLLKSHCRQILMNIFIFLFTAVLEDKTGMR